MTIMRTLLPITALLSCGLYAATDNPWYVGARLGGTHFGSYQVADFIDTDFKDDDWAGGVFMGYKFNPWFGLEGGYTYLGEADYRPSGGGFEVQGMDLVGKMTWEIQPELDVFGKLGGYWFDSDLRGPGVRRSDDDIVFTTGLGMEYYFNDDWSTRLEYQYYDDVGTNRVGHAKEIHLYALSIVYGWGAPLPVVEPAPEVVMVTETEVVEQVTAILPFDFDSDNLTPDDIAALGPVGDQLVKYPETKLYVVGHTDSRGTQAYNQKLSEERAQSVVGYLMNRFGITEERMVVKGSGELQPIAPNDTEEGRAKNRRVEVYVPEFIVSKQVETIVE